MDTPEIVLPTCEVSMDPETAVEIGLGWGIRHFELKTLWEGKRVPLITEPQRAQLINLARNYGVSFPVLSPGLFIGTEAQDAIADREVADKLPGSIDLAHALNAKLLVIFSFRKTEGVPEAWVVERLGRVAEAAHGSGLTLAIEPLPGNYGDSGQALQRLVEQVGDPFLRVNWDAANVAAAGYAAYPDEYDAVRPYVAHVHLKNYRGEAKRWALFDVGDIDLRAQLDALRRDGYRGYLAIETHTRFNPEFSPVIAASKHNLDVLRGWLGEG